jgi:hypothetical protein
MERKTGADVGGDGRKKETKKLRRYKMNVKELVERGRKEVVMVLGSGVPRTGLRHLVLIGACTP